MWGELEDEETDPEERILRREEQKNQYEQEKKEKKQSECSTTCVDLIFQQGPLGIKFNHEGSIQEIGVDTQAENMKEICRGDFLDSIHPKTPMEINCRGMSFLQMERVTCFIDTCDMTQSNQPE